jgi:hypothetical protein
MKIAIYFSEKLILFLFPACIMRNKNGINLKPVLDDFHHPKAGGSKIQIMPVRSIFFSKNVKSKQRGGG